MKICFASNNPNKLKEIRQKLGDTFEIVGLKGIGCTEDIAETETTLEGNSMLKARYVWENYGINCFADDTGLEVDALDGAPGVYSARFAGEHGNSEANLNLLLEKLQGKENRAAQFRTVVTLILEGESWQFEGIVRGKIISERRGEGGFGYDPAFIPEGYEETFAEMPLELKNKISHRALAVQKLVDFLNEKK
ncbi:MAG: non-canonical purine NTP diphosphatase [Bacteroidota bacterium]